MQLPEYLQDREFSEWNHLLKGLVQVWEVAHSLEMEQHLEQQILEDAEGTVIERLASLGHQLRPFVESVRLYEEAQETQAGSLLQQAIVLCMDTEQKGTLPQTRSKETPSTPLLIETHQEPSFHALRGAIGGVMYWRLDPFWHELKGIMLEA